jgi:hypothetical protein
LIDGVNNPAAVTAGSFTFTNVTSRHTISVFFGVKIYTIAASAGANGGISPSGDISVYGDNQTLMFTFMPKTGYEINQVLIDGVNDPAAVTAGSYVFTNIDAGHTISVTFKIITYTITASVGTNGSISPSGNVSVNHDKSQRFDFAPSAGYEINQVLIDGVNDSDAVATGFYTFTDVTADHTISVTFKAVSVSDSHIITVSINDNTGGSASIIGTENVIKGSNTTITVTPNSGYKIDSIFVDGVNIGNASTFVIQNIQADTTVVVNFVKDVQGSGFLQDGQEGGDSGLTIDKIILICVVFGIGGLLILLRIITYIPKRKKSIK